VDVAALLGRLAEAERTVASGSLALDAPLG
jgi:hypothetical protein